jgi:hypothetical protein
LLPRLQASASSLKELLLILNYVIDLLKLLSRRLYVLRTRVYLKNKEEEVKKEEKGEKEKGKEDINKLNLFYILDLN